MTQLMELTGLWYCTQCNTVYYNIPGIEYSAFPQVRYANCESCCLIAETVEFKKCVDCRVLS